MSNAAVDKKVSREDRARQFEERKQNRVTRAAEPDAQVFKARSTAIRNIAGVCAQGDRGVSMLLDRMSGGGVKLEEATPLLMELQEVTIKLSGVFAKIHEKVGIPYRKPKTIAA